MKSLFLLDPKIVFLNHGSFGACPRPVFDVYQQWQRTLERQPVEFLGRRAAYLLFEARKTLSEYLNCEPDEIVYFPNPTTAVNMVARNFARPLSREWLKGDRRFFLQPGDEILTTDHEYGALNRTWNYICRLTGAHYIHTPIPLPYQGDSDFIEEFWSKVNERTKLIFFSQITSQTALEFPVTEICRRARREGILTFIDGAHSPGQIPLDLTKSGADLYVGACHKWLCAPKGSAFLYVRKEISQQLDPLVVSWGYESENPTHCQYVDYHEWQGTRDLAAFLSVPAAIQFQKEHDWDIVRQDCHRLAVQTREQLNSFLGRPPVCADVHFHQMFTVELPESTDLPWLKNTLYDQFQIEVPVIDWAERKFLRVSIQAYNDDVDTSRLLRAIREIL